MKKIISAILIMAVIFACMPINCILAEDDNAKIYGDYKYQINDDGNITIVEYSNWKAEYAEIPSEIDGHAVTEIGRGAFRWRTALKSVKIPDVLLL